MDILQAGPEHAQVIIPLFDGYRQFYGKPSDLALAERFVNARLGDRETRFLLAGVSDSEGNLVAAGFTQLFPSFSSVAGTRILILNDLYVKPASRGQGVGRSLMRAACKYARESGYSGIKLETQETNKVGQKLYESEGYQRMIGFYQYFLSTPAKEPYF